MKKINNFILEKLRLDKNTKAPQYKFEHIPKDQHKCFWGYNWILNSEYYDDCIALLQWAQENCILNTNEETFIEKFLEDLTTNKDDDMATKTEIINGKTNNGYYKRPKCIYDICKIIKDNKLEDNIKDKNSNIIDPNDVITDLNHVTNGDIENLDWPH